MNPFYIIRHAQSRANLAELEAIKAGRDYRESRHMWDLSLADPRLTDYGQSQVKAAREKAHQISVRKVFVSPLKRTLQTCHGLFQNHPLRPQIVVCPWLTEQLGTISEASLLTHKPDPEFDSWDWSLFNSVANDYWQFSVITTHKLQALRTEFKDVHIFLKILAKQMEALYPDWLENPHEMGFRFDQMRNLLVQELARGPIALVGHQSYFKQLTLREHGKPEVLENCEIRAQTLK